MGSRARSTCDRPGEFPIPDAAVEELEVRGWLAKDWVAQPPLVITPAPSADKRDRGFTAGCSFDVERVDRVCRAFSALPHIKGRWRGRPLRLEPWQLVYLVGPVFGWVAPNEDDELVRVIRSVWEEVPRKNGKTTQASGTGLVLLAADGEPGPEVYAAAAAREQAGQVFEPAKQMALQSSALRGKVKPLTNLLRCPGNGGIFRVLSKRDDVAHGLNVSGAVIDEVHVHRSRLLIDAIETGTAARLQPLVWFITTADDGSMTTIYAEKHDLIVNLALHAVDPDPSTFGAIWAAEEGDDPFDVATMRKANPNLGVSVPLAYLQKEATKARNTPSYRPTYERLHLNLRRSQIVRWFDMRRWDWNAGLSVDRSDLRGRDCYGGLDLSTTEDFTAWALVFPNDNVRVWLPEENRNIERPGLDVLVRLWIPEAAVARRKDMRATLEQWARDGWIRITEGDVIDYTVVEQEIGQDAEQFNIAEFAYDPWQAENLRQRLLDGGLEGWKCPQTIQSLAGPSAELERLLGVGGWHHGGNPALGWMASNAVARRDAEGRLKPDRKHSPEKIDGIVASVMAVAAAMRVHEDAMPAPATGRAVGDDGPVLRPSGRLKI